MARKLGVTRSEMLQLREQGLSNDDIAHVLEISRATVFRYIGKQGGRMENLAAFNEPKKEKVETPKEEPKAPPKAVDRLITLRETFASADLNFSAQLDYGLEECTFTGHCLEEDTEAMIQPQFRITFDKLPELVTFIIGLASRVEDKKI